MMNKRRCGGCHNDPPNLAVKRRPHQSQSVAGQIAGLAARLVTRIEGRRIVPITVCSVHVRLALPSKTLRFARRLYSIRPSMHAPDRITEGSATIATGKKSADKKAAAFYNPAQVINRDLSLCVIQWYVDQQKAAGAADLSYLEALSASGLRSIRVAKETKGLTRIVANDMEPAAVEQIRANLALNGLVDGRDVHVSCADAIDVLYQHRAPSKRFDIVDLDPYGSPGMFLDGAVQAVKDGGVLQVTCTDMLTLCGNQPEVCYRKYGSVPLKARSAHEMAIRIALGAIATRAQVYGRFVVPICSLMIDYYVRVFVRVGTGGQQVQQTGSKMGYVWSCTSCNSFLTETLLASPANNPQKYITVVPPGNRECAHCGTRYKVGGPLWLGTLHDTEAVDALLEGVKSRGAQLASQRKLQGVLSVAAAELPDVPLFHNLSDLCNVLHCTMPSAHAFRSALINKGYRVSSVHMEPQGFKTDAPMGVVWDILRCWKRSQPAGKQQSETSPAFKIMATPPSFEADFTLVDDAKTNRSGGARFVKVPGWGPKTRAVVGSTATAPNVEAEADADPDRAAKKPKTDD